MNRIIWLDIARALCIILVVMGHFYPDYAPLWYTHLRSVIYIFHMPLFMFVSGCVYIATLRPSTYGDFLTRKVKRLIIPYFTVSTLIIAIKLATQHFTEMENPVSLLSFVKQFYEPTAAPFLWFIWALWCIFLLIPFFDTPRKRLYLFVASLVLHFIPVPIELFCIDKVAEMLVYFMVGVVIFDSVKLRTWINEYSIEKLSLAAVAFVFTGFLPVYVPRYGGGAMSLMGSIAGVWFVVEISKAISSPSEKSTFTELLTKMESLLCYVAFSSYIIYLTHTTFMGFVKPFFHLFRLDTTSSPFTLELFILTTVGVVFPILMHRLLLERFATTRFLFGLKKQSKPNR